MTTLYINNYTATGPGFFRAYRKHLTLAIPEFAHNAKQSEHTTWRLVSEEQEVQVG